MSLADRIINATFAPNLRVNLAEFRRTVYMTNGWERMRRWPGNWARRRDWSGLNELQEVPYAGIEGPSIEPDGWTAADNDGLDIIPGGDWQAGTRTMRFRYGDSSTGYVSNPSNPITVTVSADGKQITFDVRNGGTDTDQIPHSTDLKVDQIIIESTVADGTVYFLVGIFAAKDASGNPITLITTSISDAALEASPLPWADDGHDLPPAKRYVLAHAGRLVLYGDILYEEGVATTTHGLQVVTGANTKWSEYALGTASSPPIAGRRFFRCETYEWYEIQSRDSDTQLTLKDYFGATIPPGSPYQIASGNSLIYFSRADEPESFPPTSWIVLPTGSNGGQVTAAIGLDGAILFFTDCAAFRFTWISEPSEDGRADPIPGNRGALSPHVCVAVGGRVYALDRQGFWCYTGGLPEAGFARRVQALVEGLDFAYADDWHALYLPDLKAIRWYVTEQGSTTPTYFLQYDTMRDTWTTGRLRYGLTASHFGRYHRDERLMGMGGDENGHLWRLDHGTSDGAVSGLSHLTVAAGSSGTFIAVSQTLPPPGASLAFYGPEVYHPASGESRRAMGNAANAIFVDSAFTSLAPGDALWVGPIRAKLRTKTFYANRLANKQRPRCLRGFYIPLSSARYLQVRVYENNSSSAKTWGDMTFRGLMGNVIRPGTVTGYPATDWLVDLSDSSGRFEIPLGANAVWCMAAELEIIEPDSALSLWGMEIDGVEEASPE